jgi:hypothetical protein
MTNEGDASTTEYWFPIVHEAMPRGTNPLISKSVATAVSMQVEFGVLAAEQLAPAIAPNGSGVDHDCMFRQLGRAICEKVGTPPNADGLYDLREHLMKWIQRLTEALRRDHNLIYAMLLKHNYLQREQDFWPVFYGGGGLMNASEDRLKEFTRAGKTP